MKNSSKARYLIWRALRATKPIRIEFKTGEKLLLRQAPSDDLGIAYEVFMGDGYESPRELDKFSVRRIVDLGANVGYTCVYWLLKFPHAEVLAFEPHPQHVDLIRSHLELNDSSKRVTLYPVAASSKSGTLFLTDEGCKSKTVASAGPARIPVEQVDWFSCIGNEPIDLLKIDIEGGEYDILNDARFAHLQINSLVMEWHVTEEHPAGEEWCLSRLHQLGYATEVLSDGNAVRGMIWAFRTQAA